MHRIQCRKRVSNTLMRMRWPLLGHGLVFLQLAGAGMICSSWIGIEDLPGEITTTKTVRITPPVLWLSFGLTEVACGSAQTSWRTYYGPLAFEKTNHYAPKWRRQLLNTHSCPRRKAARLSGVVMPKSG